MIEEVVIVSPGVAWRVRINGADLQIVDDQGRERHCSCGHMLTGVHLAMALAERGDFKSLPNIDGALRMRAEQFAKRAEPPSAPSAGQEVRGG